MGFFSEMQFGFQEGLGCTEASFTISETINHMLERGSKVFSCFLDVRKAFDTVWIDGLLYKLFLELGIQGRMWLDIRDLYTNVKAQVFYEGSLSRKINVLQGTGQGHILAPFMYKVYVNGLLTVLSNHCCAILINGLRVPSPSFADVISLLTLQPSFLKTFMNICNRYGIKWRYDFNHSKSGVVTFGETKPHHFVSLKNREWLLGGTKVEELYEYKRTLVSLRITLAHFPRILTIISIRPGKKLVCYFLPVLIIGKSILLLMLSSGGKPACQRCCMVLSFLRLLLLHC